MRSLGIACGLLVAGLVASGCSEGLRLPTAPNLESGSLWGGVCTPGSGETDLVAIFGPRVTNSSDVTVLVRDVTLIEPQGMTLVEASVAGLRFPLVADYADIGGDFFDWSQRSSVAGGLAEVPAGQTRRVMLVAATADVGRASGFSVTYVANGETKVLDAPIELWIGDCD